MNRFPPWPPYPPVAPGTFMPRHYYPDLRVTPNERAMMMGYRSLADYERALLAQFSNPTGLNEFGRDPAAPELGSAYTPDIPLSPWDRQQIDSRAPEPDFVPEGITDPAERLRMKRALRQREEERQEVFNREGQWGGRTSQPLAPGGSELLLDWRDTSERVEPLTLQLAYNLEGPSANVATLGPGQIGPISVPATPQATDDITLYARLEWGNGRSSHLAYVDYQAGTQLRISGSWVKVSVLYLPTNLPTGWPAQPVQMFGTTPGSTTGPAVSASALLGKGFPTFTTAAARFTRKFLLASTGLLAFDPIPPFASAFGYATSLATGNNWQFTLDVNQFEPANGFARFNATANPTADNTFLIPSGSRFLSVQNNSGATAAMQIVYALML